MSPATTKTVYLLKAGDAIGLYRVVRPLGAGGMGEVYLVEHQHLRKRYALKILPAESASDAAFIDRFRIEARVMADLEHPGIVRVHNFGEEAGRYYLVMDYVCGRDGGSRSLEDETAWGKKLPEAAALDVAVQLCDALFYAHSFPAGAVIHRDLKPGNILIHQPPSAMDSTAPSTAPSSPGSPSSAAAPAPSASPSSAAAPAPSPSTAGGAAPTPAAGESAAPAPAPASAEKPPAHAGLGSVLRVKIADFGLARIVGVDYVKSVIDRSTRLTVMSAPQVADTETTQLNPAAGSTVSLLGTYDYMSPEQKTGANVDARSDLYSLGLIIYRTLTGHKPEGAYDPPSKYGADHRWDPILERCLKRDPADRYPDANAMKEALLVLKSPPRRRWIPAAAAAAALLLAAAGAVAIVRATRGPANATPGAAERGVTLRFTVDAKPAGAVLTVTREGAAVSEVTLADRGARLDLKPGLYRFRLAAAGFRTLEQDVVVADDRPRQWTAQLQAASGFLQVQGIEAVHVRILDKAGKTVTVAPDTVAGMLVYALPTGEYEVMAVRPNYTPVSKRAEIGDQQTVHWKVETSPLPGSLWIESPLAAEVWSGTEKIGLTGEWIRSVPIGKRPIQLRRQGYRSVDLSIDMTANAELRLAAPPWVERHARLTVRVDLAARDVAPEHQPAAAQLKIGAQEAIAVTLPWTGAVRELGRAVTVELTVPGYQPPRTETMTLRDGEERTLSIRLTPKPVKVTIGCNVPAGIYRLRDGQFTEGWRRSLFGRESPIGKTGEALDLEPFALHKLTVFAEGYQPVTVDIKPVRPGSEHDPVNVKLEPVPADAKP